MNPTSAPDVNPAPGPRMTPTLTTAATVSTLNTSPDGNRNAPIVLARMKAFERSWLERLVNVA